VLLFLGIPKVFVLVTPEGFTTMVANEGLEKGKSQFKPGPLGPTVLHPL